MRKPTGASVIIVSLAGLLVFQLLVLGLREGVGRGYAADWLRVGDTLAGVQIRGPDGQEGPLVRAGGRVLLVFHPDCTHCASVAPIWATWLSKNGASAKVLALASASLAPAQAFAQEQGWQVEVAVVDTSGARDFGFALTRRSPWVFVLDETGGILAE